MAEPFLAEIRMMGFDFAPRGWAKCDGQLLAINQNQSLFSILGTMYGGDGRTNFSLPELRGRTPVHRGSDNYGGPHYTQGLKYGAESVTLSSAEIPSHNHSLMASTTDAIARGISQFAPPNQDPPVGVLGNSVSGGSLYAGEANISRTLNQASLSDVGGGQNHNNMMPFLTVNFCIALQGLFPSRN